MKEPREFSCFDNYQDGWGNSILDEPRYSKRIPEDDEEDLEIDYEAGFDGEVVTVENNNGQFNCQNDEK